MANSQKQTSAMARRSWVSGLLLALFILVTAVFAYPAPYNRAMRAMENAVGFHLPYVAETPFRLGLDLKGGAHLVYEADLKDIADADRADALSGVRDVIERRVNAFGVAEPIVQQAIVGDSHRVIVDLPGVTDVEKAVAQIGETPVLNFRLPTKQVEDTVETPEQKAQIAEAQKKERADALAVLDRAKKGEDFAALVNEFSINTATKANGGVLRGVAADDGEFDGLIKTITSKKLKPGVIDGLYEGTSRMHIVRFDGSRVEETPHAFHLLICYKDSLRCTNERTKDEAKALIDGIKKDITAKTFIAKSKEVTDDPSGKADGGDLGYAEPGMFVKPFEDALFDMKNGQISDVVETDFGYHLIYRDTSKRATVYDLAHIEMPWTTFSDIVSADPWENTELSGKHIRRATVSADPNTGRPFVALEFNAEGAKLFGDITGANVGQVMGIFLDNEAISTPVIQQAIYGGQASITGEFSFEEAKQLAQRLNAGALPVPVNLVAQQTVGPALGAESLEKSLHAAFWGVALVALFMIAYYRLAGVVAVVALAFYVAINLALFKMFGVTMTLSGIAGFVFSVGIAVDANVLVFERLKEELAAGRDMPSAVEEAFHRAWPSIRDGNATTLIATSILYIISTGFIRGFALTLTIGVLTSMFSAYVITRTLMRLLVHVKSVRKPVFFRGLTK